MSQYLIYTYGTSPTIFMSKIDPIESIDSVLLTDIWSFGGPLESTPFTLNSELAGFHILAKLDHLLTLDEAQLLYPEFFI